MTESLLTDVSSLSVIDGVWHEKASHIGVLEASSPLPRHGRGNVYVLVETIGTFPEPQRIEQQIVELVQEHSQAAGSVTAAIREAIKAANHFLFEENLQAAREDRGIAGVTCLVLKGDDGYVGQSGPAVLYHVRREQTACFPKESTWLSSSTLQEIDVGKQPPLGLRRKIEPELSHIDLLAGDTLILASTALGKLAAEAQITTAAQQSGAKTIREDLETVAGGEDFSAVIIRLSTVGDAAVPEQADQLPAEGGRVGRQLTRAFTALRGWATSRRPVEEGLGEQEEVDDELEWEEERAPAVRPSVDPSELAARMGDALSTVGRGLARLASMMLPESDTTGNGAKPKARGSAMGRSARTAAAERGERTAANWMRMALLIPVVVILIYAITRVQYDRTRQAELRRLMAAAEEATAAFDVSTASDEQRAKLNEALALLEQAAEIRPDDQDIDARQQDLQASLDHLNRVYKIAQLDELYEFTGGDEDSAQPHDVLVHGLEVYVLDRGTQQVHRLLLNSTRDGLQAEDGAGVLLSRGDALDGVVVGELLDIAWVEAGGLLGTNTLLAVDRAGNIFRSDPGFESSALPATDSGTWKKPVAASGYYGRLYLLDPEANRVLRYSLTNGGLEGQPDDYLEAETVADLAGAVDLAIDGNVYVLHENGMISKYQEGVAVPFAPRNLDRPINRPTAILATGFMDEEGYVYVADAGNSRIVQLSKTGEFIRQLQVAEPAQLDGLKGIYVDESKKELFFVNGKGLYLATLPS